MGRKRHSQTTLAGMAPGTSTLENSLQMLTECDVCFSYDLAIHSERKPHVHPMTCIATVTAASCVPTKPWNNPCAHPQVRINNSWSVLAAEQYPAIVIRATDVHNSTSIMTDGGGAAKVPVHHTACTLMGTANKAWPSRCQRAGAVPWQIRYQELGDPGSNPGFPPPGGVTARKFLTSESQPPGCVVQQHRPLCSGTRGEGEADESCWKGLAATCMEQALHQESSSPFCCWRVPPQSSPTHSKAPLQWHPCGPQRSLHHDLASGDLTASGSAVWMERSGPTRAFWGRRGPVCSCRQTGKGCCVSVDRVQKKGQGRGWRWGQWSANPDFATY